MSKFLTAPQWYDAGGGLNKSLDVNCNGSDTATAFGNGANAASNGVAVGKGAKTLETYNSGSSVAIGRIAEASSDSVAIGADAKAKGRGVAVGRFAEVPNETACIAIGYHANTIGAEGDCIAIGNNAKCVVDSKPYRKIQFFGRTESSTPITASLIGFGKGSLLDLIYPIDSIYISVSSTDPGTIFGGTWEAFATGKTLVGVDANDTDFNVAGNAGGSKTVTLTTDQMPAHTHGLMRSQIGGHTYTGTVFDSVDGSYENVTATSAGGNEPHNNMPPYITVYMWKRTA